MSNVEGRDQLGKNKHPNTRGFKYMITITIPTLPRIRQRERGKGETKGVRGGGFFKGVARDGAHPGVRGVERKLEKVRERRGGVGVMSIILGGRKTKTPTTGSPNPLKEGELGK